MGWIFPRILDIMYGLTLAFSLQDLKN